MTEAVATGVIRRRKMSTTRFVREAVCGMEFNQAKAAALSMTTTIERGRTILELFAEAQRRGRAVWR